MSDKEIFENLPPPPEGSVFKLVKLENVSIPHPYCITAKHVAWACDNHGGRLDAYALENAEKAGAKCCTCHGEYPYTEHKINLTLFVAVPQNKDLNAVVGLVPYLQSIKAQAEAAGIKGFAFPLIRKEENE
jgi:hypothetical protein